MTTLSSLKAQRDELQRQIDALEPWEPKYEQLAYFICGDGTVENTHWINEKWQVNTRYFMGIFRTEEQAQAHLEKIRPLLMEALKK